jgi:predicted glycosyltransferase
LKIWIDILTPKQALFMNELGKRLEEKGHTVLKTTRKYEELNQLMKLKGIEAIAVGKHGGASPYKKLLMSTKRILGLSRLINEWKPDIAIGFASVEAARVSFGLSIPYFCISDSPHAEAVSRLTIPFSKKLFTPYVIPKDCWVKFGISKANIIQYKALDPVVWIKNHKLDLSILELLKLEKEKPIVTVRLEETYAAYLYKKTSLKTSIAIKAIEKLLEDNINAQIVVLPRYKQQYLFLNSRFKGKVIIPKSPIDALSLLKLSSAFIGGGGTMNAEAALLGIPTISCFPMELTYVEKFLIKKGLMEKILDQRKISLKVIKILKEKTLIEKNKKKAKELLEKMEDPLQRIINEIESLN